MRARLVGRVLLVDVLEELVGRLQRRHQHGAVGNREAVDRLEAVPRPGLHALGQRVVDADGDVDVLGLVAGHVLLELFLACRPRSRSPWPGCRCAGGCRRSARRQCPTAPPCGPRGRCRGDPGGEVLLEDAAVDDLADQGCHTLAPPVAGLPSRASGQGLAVRWSDQERYCALPGPCQAPIFLERQISGDPPAIAGLERSVHSTASAAWRSPGRSRARSASTIRRRASGGRF